MQDRDQTREERALAPTQPTSGGSLVGISGALALAQMSDQEFEQRLTAMRKGRERIEMVLKTAMRKDIDYGKVPGTDKDTLFKAGAETLCNIFHFVPIFHFDRVSGDGETAPMLAYHATCELHLGSKEGPVVGSGIGECNSWEKKYRYRTADRACPSCGALKTIIKGKAQYGGGWICFQKKGGCGAKFEDNDPDIVNQQLGSVENEDQWDLANTIAKMAAKRSHVDACLRATATSGLLTQDLEDMPAGIATSGTARERPQAQQTDASEPPAEGGSSWGTSLATPAQVKAIYVIARSEHQFSEEETDERARQTFGAVPAQLTRKQASEMIDKLKGATRPAAPANKPTEPSKATNGKPGPGPELDDWSRFWTTAKGLGYKDQTAVSAALGVKDVNEWIRKGGTQAKAIDLLTKLAGPVTGEGN